MNDSPSKDASIIGETPYLRLKDQDGWSFVERKNANGVVCIAAMTDEHKVLLVEQYRVAVGGNVIELPAGLVGDEGQADEDFEVAAQRELIEEAGYQASDLKRSVSLASSAGMTNEVVVLFLASGLEKVGDGGGIGDEEIIVHEVPISEIHDWLLNAQSENKLIDGRVYAGIHFIKSSWE